MEDGLSFYDRLRQISLEMLWVIKSKYVGLKDIGDSTSAA